MIREPAYDFGWWLDRVPGFSVLPPKRVLDRREAGNGYVRVMIVGDAGNWDERGQDIEKK